MKNAAWVMSAAVGVLILAGAFASAAEAQTISVRVVQVRASNEGDGVDKSLGFLGERIKRQFPGYKSYKRVDSDSKSGGVGETLTFGLSGGMTLSLTLAGFEGDQVSMRAVVGGVVSTSIRAKSGHSTLIGVPSGGGKLILVITPTAK